jgi:hypothetical protein
MKETEKAIEALKLIRAEHEKKIAQIDKTIEVMEKTGKVVEVFRGNPINEETIEKVKAILFSVDTKRKFPAGGIVSPEVISAQKEVSEFIINRKHRADDSIISEGSIVEKIEIKPLSDDLLKNLGWPPATHTVSSKSGKLVVHKKKDSDAKDDQ